MDKIVLVVAHKLCDLPPLPAVYRSIKAGDSSGITSFDYADNTGNNISKRNKTFCELTAVYWAWKNLDTEVLGFCHYRRYFGSPERHRSETGDTGSCFLNGQQIDRLLKDCDVILPRKRHYVIETRRSHYAHAHHTEDLLCVERILTERYPDYLPAWKWMLNTRSGHICNMFIMRKEAVNAYCAWLFDILFDAERQLDITSYSEKDRRVFGYLGERLLDVWIRKNSLRYTEVPMINLENQHWIKKGTAFIIRKIKGAGAEFRR